MYAQLCKRLSEEAPNFEEKGPCTFRLLLLNKCKAEFESRSELLDKHACDPLLDEEERRQLAKRKMLGNIKFIGELGKLEILSEGILHRCIQELLCPRRGEDPSEDLECLSQIMRTCGRILDSDKGKKLMDQYFERMSLLADNFDLPPRIRFMLKDVIELRRDCWRPRKSAIVEGPMPIHQIRPVDDDRLNYRASLYLRQWISGNDVYTTDGKIVFCEVCSKEVAYKKMYHVEQHSRSVGHMKRAKDAETSKKSTQALLTTMQEKSLDQHTFSKDLCMALVAANIPWSKLSNPAFRSFLAKYTFKTIPDESTLQKNYLENMYDTVISSIREEVGENPIWLSIDESTDALGRYVVNVVVGSLSPNGTKSRLLLSKFLDAANHASIARTVKSALKILWPAEDRDDRLLLLVTDAAPHMIKAGKTLMLSYEKMIHLTCLAHGMHHVAEEIRNLFPSVNALISATKKVFLKNPSRCATFKNMLPKTSLPPAPVITRWGTWLEAALYYYENFGDIQKVVDHLCEEKEEPGCKDIGLILKDAKAAFQCDSVVADLGYIGAHFSHLPDLIKQLEDPSLPLTESTKLVNQAPLNFPGVKGKKIHQKIVMVLDKNPGWKKINNIKIALEGDGGIVYGLSPKEVSCFKYAPITSCDVERSFSKHKYILNDRRTNFTELNLEKYLIAHSYYV